MGDKAIIVRSNGESHLIEKGIGCLSLWRFEGKQVYINSPSLFLGVGSRLLIPDAGQECRIWDSEFLASGSARPSFGSPGASSPTFSLSGSRGLILSVQKALKVLDYDVVADGILTDKTKEAFGQYHASKGHPRTEAGIRLSLLSLAADLLNKQPSSTEALTIAGSLDIAARAATRSSSEGCVEGHWISTVMASGKLIKLEDGSIWEVDLVDTIYSMLWLPTEEILVCGQTLINTNNGEKVRATLLK